MRISSFSCFWVSFLFSNFFPLDMLTHFSIFLRLVSFDWLLDFHHAVVWILLVSSQQVLICFGGVFNFLWKNSRLALLLRGSFILLWFLLIVPVFNEILLPSGWNLNISKSYVTPGNFWNLKCIWNSYPSKYTPWIVFIDSYFMFWRFFCLYYFCLNLDWLFKLFSRRQLFSLTVCCAQNMQKFW